MKIILDGILKTTQLANCIASIIPNKFVVILNGELGAGKTTLVRETLYSLGVTNAVKSPTYTLVEPYSILPDIKVYHFDLYRFDSIDDWYHLGFDEYFIENSICFIEWAVKAYALIPTIDWDISIISLDQNAREVNIVAKSDLGKIALENLVRIWISKS